jgi:hypothetical protein
MDRTQGTKVGRAQEERWETKGQGKESAASDHSSIDVFKRIVTGRGVRNPDACYAHGNKGVHARAGQTVKTQLPPQV